MGKNNTCYVDYPRLSGRVTLTSWREFARSYRIYLRQCASLNQQPMPIMLCLNSSNLRHVERMKPRSSSLDLDDDSINWEDVDKMVRRHFLPKDHTTMLKRLEDIKFPIGDSWCDSATLYIATFAELLNDVKGSPVDPNFYIVRRAFINNIRPRYLQEELLSFRPENYDDMVDFVLEFFEKYSHSACEKFERLTFSSSNTNNHHQEIYSSDRSNVNTDPSLHPASSTEKYTRDDDDLSLHPASSNEELSDVESAPNSPELARRNSDNTPPSTPTPITLEVRTTRVLVNCNQSSSTTTVPGSSSITTVPTTVTGSSSTTIIPGSSSITTVPTIVTGSSSTTTVPGSSSITTVPEFSSSSAYVTNTTEAELNNMSQCTTTATTPEINTISQPIEDLPYVPVKLSALQPLTDLYAGVPANASWDSMSSLNIIRRDFLHKLHGDVKTTRIKPVSAVVYGDDYVTYDEEIDLLLQVQSGTTTLPPMPISFVITDDRMAPDVLIGFPFQRAHSMTDVLKFLQSETDCKSIQYASLATTPVRNSVLPPLDLDTPDIRFVHDPGPYCTQLSALFS